MPANGESVTISTVPTVPVDVSLSLLKRTMSDTGKSADCFLSCNLCELLHVNFSSFIVLLFYYLDMLLTFSISYSFGITINSSKV